MKIDNQKINIVIQGICSSMKEWCLSNNLVAPDSFLMDHSINETLSYIHSYFYELIIRAFNECLNLGPQQAELHMRNYYTNMKQVYNDVYAIEPNKLIKK